MRDYCRIAAKRALLSLLTLVFAALGGCGGAGSQTPSTHGIDDAAANAGAIDAAVGSTYPAFPGEAGGPYSAVRAVSDSEIAVDGKEWVEEHGENNRPGVSGPNVWVIAPGGDDDLAWAKYSIEGLTVERPVDIAIGITGVIAPGGDDDLPISYWLGLSDYTNYRWEWRGDPEDAQGGPYTASAQLVLNSEEVRERYVSAAGVFHFVILTESSGIEPDESNPEGITSVEIVASTIAAKDATAPGYISTAPHYTLIESISLGGGAGAGAGSGKGVSALDDSQYVTITWEHIQDLVNPNNEAFSYQVLRQLVGDDEKVLLNTVGAPGLQFVDPTDANPLVDEAIPGATYNYYVRAVNPGGFTPLSTPERITIPLLLPPTDLAASDGWYADKILLTWTKAESATSYEIYRDNRDAPIAELGDVDTWDDSAVGLGQSYIYWLKAFDEFGESGFSASDTGYAIVPGPGDWWMFGREPTHNRRSPFTGPSTNALKWSYTTGDNVYSSPSIGVDGTIYVASEDGKLHAINPDSTLKWSYTTGSVVNSSPAIGADGTIYVGSRDTKLYAINPDGTLKWSYTTGELITSSPAIGEDGTIYLGSVDGKLYAINPDGTLKWGYLTTNAVHSSPAIGADGTIYVGNSDKLYAINPDGTLKWSYPTGGGFSSPAIGADGTIYVGSESGPADGKLYAINSDGTLKWTYTTGSFVQSSPAIGSDGTIYVGSADGKLYAIGPGEGT